MPKVDALTPEQEADLPVFRQRYLDLATKGGRIDRDELESALSDAYAVIGKPAPKLFIFDSPAECLLALKIINTPKGANLSDNLWANLRVNLRANLWANLRANLGDNLGDNLRANLWINLKDNLSDSLWANLEANLKDNLEANLGNNLKDSLGADLWANLSNNLRVNLRTNLRDSLGADLWADLRDSLKDSLGANLWAPNFLWGSQDLYWIAYYRFAQKIGCKFAPEDAQNLDIIERISSQCEWWWPYENVVIASQRSEVSWDSEGRIHSETGMAVRYRGGYGLYMWRGQVIPEEWITKGPPEPADCLKVQNTEQRRIACEMRGWHNILPALPKSKMIDADANPQVGELWEGELPDHGTERFLKVQCGTGRTFALPVGLQYNTAREANAATYGIAPQILDNVQFRT